MLSLFKAVLKLKKASKHHSLVCWTSPNFRSICSSPGSLLHLCHVSLADGALRWFISDDVMLSEHLQSWIQFLYTRSHMKSGIFADFAELCATLAWNSLYPNLFVFVVSMQRGITMTTKKCMCLVSVYCLWKVMFHIIHNNDWWNTMATSQKGTTFVVFISLSLSMIN